MTNYSAPVKDLQFVLDELVEMDKVANLPGFEEATPDMVSAILDEAAKMANEVLAPLNWVGDQEHSKLIDGKVVSPSGFADAYQQFSDSGWTSISQPTEYGGQGLPFAIQVACSEMWNASNMAFGLCPMLTASAIESMYEHADETMNQTYLTKLITGEWTGTMCLTEPQAGSDLAAVRATAEPSGEHYLIKGTKIYITWGDHDMTTNTIHLVLARLPDAPEGVKGISLFVVPKFLVNADGSVGERNDVKPVSLEHKLGIHASPTCVMSFGDADGAVGYLVGEAHRGLSYMFTMMNHARLEVGVQGVGVAERAHQKAVEYARERVQGFAPGQEGRVTIVHHADVRRMLMTMRSLVEAGRAVALVGSAAHDFAHHEVDKEASEKAHQRLDFMTPVVKAWCTELAQEVTSIGVQVHGGMGFVEETGAAQFYRDARITTIYEGTTGIQANDLIGRKLLRDNGAAWETLRAELTEFLGQMQAEAGDDFPIISQRFAEALEEQIIATEYILENAQHDPHLPGAVSYNYLMLTGYVLGGWLLAKSALISAAHLKAEGADTTFYANKIATARFYAEQILPRTHACRTGVVAGSTTIMGIAAEDL